MQTYILLHNIRSAHNVGSVFRTGDGAGVSKIFLTGYTPTPVDRFGREQKEILKTSLGATHTIPYEVINDPSQLIAKLKSEGVEIIAVEQTNNAIDYRSFSPIRDCVFIFGNEVTGIEEEILALADRHIEIPLLGRKESLNVSVCAGIILFQYREDKLK